MDAAARPGIGARLAGWAAAAPVSLALMTANIAAFAWVEAQGAAGDQAALVRLGALERSRVWAGEPWRLISAAFLHVGWFHLACNVALGIVVCGLVERALGKVPLLVAYLTSAAGGSALSLLGQDGVSAGASGALFGMVGAILALHLRALGGWRPFLRSRATHGLAAGVLSTSFAGPFLVPIDHLAHAGGLAVGSIAGWLMSRPPARRGWPWAAFAAALAVLVAAAAWPRSAMTRYEALELERAVYAALRAGDAPSARRILDGAATRSHGSARLEVYRALLHVQEGDLEGAIAIARPLASAEDVAVRGEATRIVVGVAKALGYRLYAGDAGERNPSRGLGYMDEACRAGDAESCRNAARVREASP